jgi:FkbM family methyltransferase
LIVEEQIRIQARKFLPSRIRKPLGSVAGWLYYNVRGVAFDWFVRRLRVDGCEFEIPKDLTRTSERGLLISKNEPEERELVRKFIRSDDSVLEVGACLGIVSCVTNKLLRDNARHVVVEGNPFCIPAIHRNREINRCGFLVENCALSNQRHVTFYLHPGYLMGGSTQHLMGGNIQSQNCSAVRVPGRTLEELDARYGPFSALVMDIEGAELEGLETAGAILNKYRVVIIELHEWAIGAESVERCREIFRRAGLQFKQRAGMTEAWQRD